MPPLDNAPPRASSVITAVRTVPLDQLTREELDAWQELRTANPQLDSPYFHPGFARAVHASGSTVLIAVGRDGAGRVRALLPCHRKRSLLLPAGWPAADFQGPIMAPGSSFPPSMLLTGGVRRFEFDHLLGGCEGFEPWVERSMVSPFLDPTGGLDGYLGRISRSGREHLKQARRDRAKAERTYGPVRFEADAVDAAALDRLIELKRAQYAATGVEDYFAPPERRAMLHSLLGTRGDDFAGMLSTLYAGTQLVAAHFGLRSGQVLHWWFPVYDRAFAPLSPGWMLLRETVAAAPALGITRIDLGRGDDDYKRRAKTGQTSVSQGLVTTSVTRRALRAANATLVATLKSSPAGPGLRRVARALRARRR
ncbi:MAG: GNAT family N-acetyltransferase [Micromonosporaceae bacterium]|nr:GNAT family N-acetyltransferase [Micromonosporaceae bacterium]